MDGLRNRNVNQTPAPPSHPYLRIAGTPQNIVAHFVWPNMWIVREKQGHIMAMNFLKHNILLPILTTSKQLLLLVAGLIADPRLSLTHNLVVKSRVHDPTFCAMSKGDLDTTKEVISCQRLSQI